MGLTKKKRLVEMSDSHILAELWPVCVEENTHTHTFWISESQSLTKINDGGVATI